MHVLSHMHICRVYSVLKDKPMIYARAFTYAYMQCTFLYKYILKDKLMIYAHAFTHAYILILKDKQMIYARAFTRAYCSVHSPDKQTLNQMLHGTPL